MTPKIAKVRKDNRDFIEGLYFKFIWVFLPLMYWHGLPAPIEVAKVILFIGVTFTYFGYVIGSLQQPITFGKQKPFFFLLLLLLLQTTSSVFGERIGISLFGIQYRYQGLVTQIGYLLLVFIISISRVSTRYIKFGAVALAIATIIELVLFGGARTTGLLGNPNFTGGYLAMSLPFVNNFYFSLITLAAIVATGSRSAMLAVGVLGLMLVLKKFKSKLLIALAVLILAAVSILGVQTREVSSFDNRATIWLKGYEGGMRKYITGWGLENFELAFKSSLKADDFDLKNIRVDKAHNEFLEVFVSSGVLGLFLYILIVIITLIRLWKQPIILFSFVAFLITASLNVVNTNEYMFFYLAVGSAVAINLPKEHLSGVQSSRSSPQLLKIKRA